METIGENEKEIMLELQARITCLENENDFLKELILKTSSETDEVVRLTTVIQNFMLRMQQQREIPITAMLDHARRVVKMNDNRSSEMILFASLFYKFAIKVGFSFEQLEGYLPLLFKNAENTSPPFCMHDEAIVYHTKEFWNYIESKI